MDDEPGPPLAAALPGPAPVRAAHLDRAEPRRLLHPPGGAPQRRPEADGLGAPALADDPQCRAPRVGARPRLGTGARRRPGLAGPPGRLADPEANPRWPGRPTDRVGRHSAGQRARPAGAGAR